MINQFGDSARLEDRYDAVNSEPASARCAPDVYPGGRSDQQETVNIPQRTTNSADG